MQEASGSHLEDIYEASEGHLETSGGIWEASGAYREAGRLREAPTSSGEEKEMFSVIKTPILCVKSPKQMSIYEACLTILIKKRPSISQQSDEGDMHNLCSLRTKVAGRSWRDPGQHSTHSLQHCQDPTAQSCLGKNSKSQHGTPWDPCKLSLGNLLDKGLKDLKEPRALVK